MSNFELVVNFDPKFYCLNNSDLRNLNLDDVAALKHFEEYGIQEFRPYGLTRNVAERFSMTYLRGDGLEIGPGNAPVPMHLAAKCHYADICNDSIFSDNNTSNEFLINLNHRKPPKYAERFDFIICRHVLEHCDSFIRSLKLLSQCIKSEGKIYIALPMLSKSPDKFWIRNYGLVHHAIEYFLPNLFNRHHARDFLRASNLNEIKRMCNGSSEINNFLKNYSYISHKHNYSPSDWIGLINFSIKYFIKNIEIEDFSICTERDDLNIILKKYK